jgi:hypothetical protein
LRDTSHPHLSRLQSVRLTDGDVFYLRAIHSFQDALCVDGLEYCTFQEAAIHMGIFADDNEGEYALREAIYHLMTPHQLRLLFVHLLVNDCLPTPISSWNEFHVSLAQDLIDRHAGNVELGVNDCLERLTNLMEEHNRSLADFGLPQMVSFSCEIEHELETWSSDTVMLSESVRRDVTRLNVEQHQIYEKIMEAIDNDVPLYAYIDSKAGRGKTFLINVICNSLRARGDIAIPTATSAFAAQLYHGGRTTHSTLKVHVLYIIINRFS